MRNEDFEKRLSQTLHREPDMVHEGHLKNTLLLVRKEAYQRNKRERISFTHFLFMQIKFIGWKVWAAQGLFLLMICGMLNNSYGGYFLEHPQSAPRVLFGLSVLLFMTALPLLYRSVRYKMQEIEAAARFSSVKLLIAKLAVIGIGDIFVLTGIFAAAVIRTSLQADSIVLYLCFPFLLVSSGSLFMLGHFTPKWFLAGSIGLCSVLLMLCFTIPGHYESLFQQSFSAGWLAVCGLLAAFGALQFRYILHRSAYTEMQVA